MEFNEESSFPRIAGCHPIPSPSKPCHPRKEEPPKIDWWRWGESNSRPKDNTSAFCPCGLTIIYLIVPYHSSFAKFIPQPSQSVASIISLAALTTRSLTSGRTLAHPWQRL